MWLATIYYFLQLTKIPYLKNKGESKPKAIINKRVWSLFASLTSELGYTLLKIIKLRKESPN